MEGIEEVKTLVTKLGETVEEFKQANNNRWKEIEKKGAADAITAEKVDRLNAEITRIETAMSDAQKKTAAHLALLEKAQARPGLVGRASTAEDEEHKKAFGSFIRKGTEAGLIDVQKKAMSVGSDADGGYMVPVEMNDRVVTRVFETTPMRQLATVMTINTEAVEFLGDTDEASASWVGETAARNDTNTPQIRQIRITAHELHAQPKVTQKLLDDAVMDIESWLANKVADKFARTENNAFINGDGVIMPRGIASHTTAATPDASRSWGVIEHVATGASGAFAASNPADKLIDLVQAVKTGYLSGAAWIMPRAVIAAIRKFKEATTNAYLWQPGLQAGQPSLLLGFPLVLSEDIPAMAAGSLSAAFGNFKEAYTIVDRVGIRVLRDPYTNAPFVKFRTTKRVGGDVTNFEAVKFLKFT